MLSLCLTQDPDSGSSYCPLGDQPSPWVLPRAVGMPTPTIRVTSTMEGSVASSKGHQEPWPCAHEPSLGRQCVLEAVEAHRKAGHLCLAPGPRLSLNCTRHSPMVEHTEPPSAALGCRGHFCLANLPLQGKRNVWGVCGE